MPENLKTYTIRTAVTDDISLLQALGIETFTETFADYNSPQNMKRYLDKSFSRAQIEQEVRDPAGEFLLLMDRAITAGYARIKAGTLPGQPALRAMEIERIYARREYVGKKAGSTLMEACLARARQKGYHTLWLGVWERNARAIHFYERWGFERFGEHVFWLGDDAQTDWLMKRNIDL
ncbi:MAG TPA: GNAT family N-acetyltransferase [Ohtaekwangia sp.]|nr:GNAT family N-acetyltransferase [Ohtaekwangia sp.]